MANVNVKDELRDAIKLKVAQSKIKTSIQELVNKYISDGLKKG